MEIDYKSSLHSHRRYKKNKKKLTSNKVCESSNLGEKKQKKKMIVSILGKSLASRGKSR